MQKTRRIVAVAMVRPDTTRPTPRNTALAVATLPRSRLLTATIWLKDILTFDEMNAVWDAWVPEGQAPARACVETKFPFEQVKVEIQVTARR